MLTQAAEIFKIALRHISNHSLSHVTSTSYFLRPNYVKDTI